jgi:hypothetical protein
VDVCQGSGLTESANDLGLSVYPNPATDNMTITWNSSTEMNVRLVDFSGRLIRSEGVNGKDFQLNRKGINNGIYLLILSDKNGNTTSQRVIFN